MKNTFVYRIKAAAILKHEELFLASPSINWIILYNKLEKIYIVTEKL